MPGLHDAGVVLMQVLRNEATLYLMYASGQEWVELFERPFQELAYAKLVKEVSPKILQLYII